MRADLLTRFWNKVLRMESGCWEWQAQRDADGYGRFMGLGKKMGLAHRFAFSTFVAPIPPSLCVLHDCDNPPCVRPDHLKLGTHADNVRDKIAKGRSRGPNRGKTVCKRGHPLTPDNIYRSGLGGKSRTCRTCNLDWHRTHKQRKQQTVFA